MTAPFKPIRCPEDHELAVARIEALWGAAVGSPEGDELEVLSILVDVYEQKNWPAPQIDPIDTVRAHMDLNGYTRADLALVIGSTSRASEILNKKRPLSLTMIRALHTAWGLPIALLVGAYELAA